MRLVNGLSANDDVFDPGIQIGLDRVFIADATTDLHRNVRIGGNNGMDNTGIDRFAGKGAV